MPTSGVAVTAQKGRTIQFIRYSGITLAHSPYPMPTSGVAVTAQKGRTIQFIYYSGITLAHSPYPMPTSGVAVTAQKGRTIQFIYYSGITLAHSPVQPSTTHDAVTVLSTTQVSVKAEQGRRTQTQASITANCVFVSFKDFAMKVKHHAPSPCIRCSCDDMCPFEIPANQIADTPDERLPIQNKTVCSHCRVVRHRKAVFFSLVDSDQV